MDPDLNAEAAPDSQAEVIAFLCDPVTHADADSVQRIDTHAAIVFLAGPSAYKIKRAVTYPFLDFSTLEKRRVACVHEIEVNQANAPQIYKSAIPITRQPDGSLAIDGSGAIVEWAVHMARFDETKTLDRVIAAGPLPDGLIDALARAMAEAHARAPVRNAAPWIDDLRRYVDQNTEAFTGHTDVFAPDRAAALTKASIDTFARIRPLLEARGAAGHVRLCHGDAHLGNIALLGGRPVLFDAVEFDDLIATADVLYDLAYLLMDLWQRGQAENANRTFNRYLVECGCDDHYDGLAALPFFLMMRAVIRAKVTASRRDFNSTRDNEALSAQADGYFSAACGFLDGQPPRLLAVGGLSGSGKSTVAARVAGMVGQAPGAVVLRSDVLRKRICGVGETDRLPPRAYSEDINLHVYERLSRTAARVLETGYSVIADAVFARRSERDAIAEIARSRDIPFTGFWLDAPQMVLTERVGARSGDASDADEAVITQQMGYDLGDVSWARIDASGTVDHSVQQVRRRLG